MKAKRTKFPKGKRDSFYRQIFRIVDGAVLDAIRAHPDYLSGKGRALVRSSISKRVAGAITGYVEQSTQGRSARGRRLSEPEVCKASTLNRAGSDSNLLGASGQPSLPRGAGYQPAPQRPVRPA